MNNRFHLNERKVPDPFQRTLTGGIAHFLWSVIAGLLLVGVTFGIIGGVAVHDLYKRVSRYIEEDIKPNAHYSLTGVRLNQTSFIYAKNPETGEYEPLCQLLAVENRVWVDYADIPRDIINATVAIEDKRFWEHDGVDWQRTLGASANIFLGGSTFGGSTLTQQLIKNLSQDKEVTVRRKLLEIYRALDFEEHYTKEEILEWYLNTIYLGEGAYGIKSAARIYFGKELSELTVKECACLIGITNNPSRYDPYIFPENNEYRTLTILKEMRDQGYIEDADYDAICDQQLEFKSLVAGDQKFTCSNCGYEGVIRKYKADGDDYICPTCGEKNQFEVEKPDYYTYFEDTVIRDVIADLVAMYDYTPEFAGQMVTTGGFRIYCTIDLDAQAKVDAVYQDIDNIPDTYSSQQLQSGIIVIDNETGDIVAMAGGVGEKEGNLTWNRATQSQLSPGSSIKPLTVYGPALAMGVITPGSAYEDSPYMKINGKDWPLNENRKNAGWMLVNNGLAQSLNTIAVKVLADVTPEASFQFAKEKLGLKSLVESEEINGTNFSDIDLAPLGLGQLTHGLTIREMATAYATYPNQGEFRQSRTYLWVEDSEGKIILDNRDEPENPDVWVNPNRHIQAMDSHAAWYMVWMLRYAVENGTGTPARITGVPVAGKTGTTSSNRDRWFSGFTPRYTATVWCGFDEPEEIHLKVNRNPSAVLWQRVMASLHEGMTSDEVGSFVQPTDENFYGVNVCSQTGLLAGKDCTAKKIYLFASDVPKETCNNHEGFAIKVCHPGENDKTYYATDSCRAYHTIVHSAEFQRLAQKYPELLGGFEENEIEEITVMILKDDGKNDASATLEQVLEDQELDHCPIHTAQRLRELQAALQEARELEGSEPEPLPPPGPEP